MSLEPAAAAVSGWLLLHEHLTIGQWLAVVLIVIASAGATLTAPRAQAAIGGE
jgi:inner membrane transporter RhtA